MSIARYERITLVAVALLAFVLPANAERYALLIGVNDCPAFRQGKGIALRKLRGAENDAALIGQTLVENFGFAEANITTLLGGEAISATVHKEMQRLADSLTVADSLVFYFAGHGTRTEDLPPKDELDDGLDEALCLYDTTPTGDNLLVDDELREWLASLGAGQVTVILDSCHSGSGTKDPTAEYTPRYLTLQRSPRSLRALDDDAKPWTEITTATKALGARRIALYACSNDQSAYERRFYTPRPTHRGQFTHYLLAALQSPEEADANGDGKLSVEEAAVFVESKIDQAFNTRHADAKRQQTPRYESGRGSWELISVE